MMAEENPNSTAGAAGTDTAAKQPKKQSSGRGITIASIISAVVLVGALVLISIWVYRNNTPILGTSIITTTDSASQGASASSSNASTTGSWQDYKVFKSTDPDEGYGLYGYFKHNDFFNVDVLVIKPQFSDAREFAEGVAAVQDASSGLWGYINPGGQWVIQPQYSAAESFSGGTAKVTDTSGKTLTIDASGK